MRQQLGLYIQEHLVPSIDLLMQTMHVNKIKSARQQMENSQEQPLIAGNARTRPEMVTSPHHENSGVYEANIGSEHRYSPTDEPIHEQQGQMTSNGHHPSTLPYYRDSLVGYLPQSGGYAAHGQMHTSEVPPQAVQGTNDLGIAALAIQRLMQAMYQESK